VLVPERGLLTEWNAIGVERIGYLLIREAIHVQRYNPPHRDSFLGLDDQLSPLNLITI
jgi:hypothetical protein